MKAGQKYCEVFLKDATVYVFPNLEPQPGVRLASQPIARLPLESPPEVIGEAVLQALSLFRRDVPFPENFEAASVAALNGTGFKNWKTFTRDARRLGVSSDGDKVKITPTVSDGRNFADLPEKAVTCSSIPDEVGRGVLEGFSRCERKARVG
ncbi:MAG TPA: hypothetical protein VE422_02460 [Terriglobia bacterium]|nr:hypothetical protein [Terriglobia bacterium]